MRRERAKQTFKLQVLAIVLALALLWYAIHPAPSPVRCDKPEGEPDEKRREAEPQLARAAILPIVFGTPGAMSGSTPPAPIEDEEDFDWPEFIDG